MSDSTENKFAASIQTIIDELQGALADADKFQRGNDSAGARLRKKAQTVIASCKDFRKDVQEERQTRKV